MYVLPSLSEKSDKQIFVQIIFLVSRNSNKKSDKSEEKLMKC